MYIGKYINNFYFNEKEKDLIFNRILADYAKLGISIEWEDFI